MFDDLMGFNKVQQKQKQIFLERRKMYGSHLENAVRFPFVCKAGLYLKCVRTILQIENGGELDEDTLIDIANYATLILSIRSVTGG